MSIGNTRHNTFETPDLDLASFLISGNHSNYVGMKSEGSKRIFVFSPVPDDAVINGFVNDEEITFRPARLFDARRRMVNLLNKRQAQQNY